MSDQRCQEEHVRRIHKVQDYMYQEWVIDEKELSFAAIGVGRKTLLFF